LSCHRHIKQLNIKSHFACFSVLASWWIVFTFCWCKAMSSTVAAASAVFFSIGALFCCLIFVPMLMQRLDSVRMDIRIDMDEFNVIAEDILKELEIRGRAVSLNAKHRVARQVNGLCNCEEDNPCPCLLYTSRCV
ncbi:hypothetical protein T4E_5346, partial [Trichinella pseudospiralis]